MSQSVTTTDYVDTKEVVVDKAERKNGVNDELDSKYMQTREKVECEGTEYESKIVSYYPFDYPNDPIFQKMVEKNDVSTPIEQRYYSKGNLRKIVKNTYALDASVPCGYVIRSMQESSDSGCTTFETVETYDKYLSSGLVSQITRQDGVVVSLIWGYRGSYLIGMVENASNEMIKANKVDLEAISQSSIPDFCALESLRGLLPDARVTLYEYRRLVGLTKKELPSGRMERLEYDTMGRLRLKRNTDGKITSFFDYHYAQ